MKNILLLLGILVVSIAFAYFAGKEKPFDKPFNLEGQPVTVTLHFYEPSQSEEFVKRYMEVMGIDRVNGVLKGFAVFYPEDSECEIHMPRIKGQRDGAGMETLGHEFLHCIYGKWHKE